MVMGAVQMSLSIYMGYFIPEEYHYLFAFSARDFFLISFVAFSLGLYGVLKETNES